MGVLASHPTLTPTSEDIEDDVINAGDAPAPRDPLVIDLGNEGILLTSIDNGVYFDLDKNGFAENCLIVLRMVSLLLIETTMENRQWR